MRKSVRVICLILAIAILTGLCAGCVNKTMVEITVGGDQIGTALSDIPVTVKVNGKDTPCRVEWSMLTETMDCYSIPTEALEEGHDYLVYIYYDAGTELDDENLEITVAGADLDYSQMVGNEIMTAVRINLLEKGNLTLICSGITPGAFIKDPYIAIRKDGEFVLFNYLWSVTTSEGSIPADESTVVEYGKYYDLSLELFPDEGFVLDDYPVRLNCGDGKLLSIEQQGDVVYATIRYYYIMATVHEFFAPNVQIEVGSEQLGTALSDIPVTIMVQGKRATCRAEWQMLNDAQDAYVAASGTLEEGKDYLVNVHYTADLTEEDLDVDKIAVFGAELDHSEIVSDGEILTVVRVNLLEKGNLTLTVGSAPIGMPIEHAYCAVKLDGEKLDPEYSWSILKGASEEPVDETGYFEEGNYYQITIRFIAPDDFKPEDWTVRLNCEDGELLSLEPDGAEYVAKIGFDYGGGHVCFFVENGEIPATNTCSESGQVFYICYECGEEKAEFAPALGHAPDWSNATYTAPQNCREYGVESASCIRCGAVQSRETADVGSHAWLNTGCEDNCDQGMTNFYTCSVCGQTKSEQTQSSHSWNEVAQDDKCDAGMTILYTCEKCGASKSETVSSDHSWIRIDQAGSCPYGVQLVHECSKCGTIDTSQWIYPGDHSFGTAVYWNNNVHVRYCTECGEMTRENHTCDATGYCEACDTFIVN